MRRTVFHTVVKRRESAGISLAPNELNRRRHVRGSMDADGDKFVELESLAWMI